MKTRLAILLILLVALYAQIPAYAQATWSHTFDFTLSNGGWGAYSFGANYTAAGWRTVPGNWGNVAYIQRSFTTTTITSVTMNFAWDSSPTRSNGFIKYGSVNYGFNYAGSPQAANATSEASLIQVALGNGSGTNGSGPHGTITSVVVHGTGTNPFEETPPPPPPLGDLTRPLASADIHPQWGMYDMDYVSTLDENLSSDYPYTVYSFSQHPNAPVSSVAAGTVIEVTPYGPYDCPVVLQLINGQFHRCTVTIPQVITQEISSYLFVWEMIEVSRIRIRDATVSERIYTYYIANVRVKVGDVVVAGCVIGDTIQLKNPNNIELSDLSASGNLSLSADRVGLSVGGGVGLDIRSLLVDAGLTTMWVTNNGVVEQLYPSLTQEPDKSNCSDQSLSACINTGSDLTSLQGWAADGGVELITGGGVEIPADAGLHQYDIMIDPEVTYTLNVQARAISGEDFDVDPPTLAMMVGATGQAVQLSSGWRNYSFTPNPADIQPDGNITAIHLYNYSSYTIIQVRYVCLVPNTVSTQPNQCYFANHEFDADGTGWIVGSGVTFASGQAYMRDTQTLSQYVHLLPDDSTAHTYTIRAQARLLANPSYTAQVGKEITLEYDYPSGSGYTTLGIIDSARVTTEGLHPYDGTVNVEYPYILTDEFVVSAETTASFMFRVSVTDPDHYLTGLRIDYFCIEPGGDGTFPGQPGGGFTPPFLAQCAVVPVPIDNNVSSWTWYHWKNLERFFKCDLMVLLNKFFQIFYDFQRVMRYVMRWWIAMVHHLADWATSVLWWMDGHFRNMAVGQVTTIYEGGGGPSIWDVLLALINNIFAPLVGMIGQLVDLFVGIISQVANLLFSVITIIISLVLTFIIQAFGLLSLAQSLLASILGAFANATPLPIPGLPNCADPKSSAICVGVWVMDNTVFSGTGAVIIPILVGILSIHLMLWVVGQLKQVVIELGQTS